MRELISYEAKQKESYQIHIIETEKFKTNQIAIKFRSPLSKKNSTKRALLPHIMQSATKKFTDTPALRAYLEDLYGAVFYADVSKKGEDHIISFNLEIVNEQYVPDKEPLLEKAFSFLHEVIFNPLVENNRFSPSIISVEKRNQKQRLQAIFDDKMRYASQKLVEEMCKDELYSLNPQGNLEDIESITDTDLFDYYKEMISNDLIDVYVVGNIQMNEVEELCDKYLTFEKRGKLEEKVLSSPKKIDEVKQIIETQNIQQGKLNIGYRTHITYKDPDYFALQVFNGLFGGFAHSKLFINVREKASLAYYAASRYESHKGLMFVMSGIQAENFQKALDIISLQLEEMKQGKFTEEELEQTKAVIINQLIETTDTPRGLIEILYHNVIANKTYSLKEWIENIITVTAEEVINVANKIECDTIYFLKGEEEN